MYQGLVKTCSHPIVVEVESMKDKIATKDETESSNNQYGLESNVKIETYKDYMYLWKNILNVVQLKVFIRFINLIIKMTVDVFTKFKKK